MVFYAKTETLYFGRSDHHVFLVIDKDLTHN